jgi:hypothetical protein
VRVCGGALRLHGPRSANGLCDLCASDISGDVVSKAGIRVGVAGAVGDRNKPAWPVMSPAISLAAVSKSANGLAMVLMA